MATTSPTSSHITPSQTPIRPFQRPSHNLIALWHLLSLDAPTVAALWTWFIASTNHIHLPTNSIAAMFLAVWTLYAADRLLDARLLDAHLLSAKPLEATTLESRHYFHHRHRNAFTTGVFLASIALAILLPRLSTEAIRLYLILGGLVFGYFILIHATHSAHRFPKEIAVGIFFAAAIFIPTVARQPNLRLPLLPSAMLFAALCSLNCLFIYAWEHGPESPTLHRAHATTRFALSHLSLIAITITVTSIALVLLDHRSPWPIPLASSLAAILLLSLHHFRNNIASTTLRAAADLALLTPILFLPFLG